MRLEVIVPIAAQGDNLRQVWIAVDCGGDKAVAGAEILVHPAAKWADGVAQGTTIHNDARNHLPVAVFAGDTVILALIGRWRGLGGDGDTCRARAFLAVPVLEGDGIAVAGQFGSDHILHRKIAVRTVRAGDEPVAFLDREPLDFAFHADSSFQWSDNGQVQRQCFAGRLAEAVAPVKRGGGCVLGIDDQDPHAHCQAN